MKEQRLEVLNSINWDTINRRSAGLQIYSEVINLLPLDLCNQQLTRAKNVFFVEESMNSKYAIKEFANLITDPQKKHLVFNQLFDLSNKEKDKDMWGNLISRDWLREISAENQSSMSMNRGW